MIITIDCKSGTRKSTIAKTVAKVLDYLYVETDAIYRKIAYFLEQKGIIFPDSTDIFPLLEYSIINDCLMLSPSRCYNKIDNINENLYGRLAVNLAKSDKIKKLINNSIKAAIGDNNAVIEGFDVTTNLYPSAELKILLIADMETQSYREYSQLKNKSAIEETIGTVKSEYNEIIDTSIYDINDTVSKIVRLVYKKTHKLSLIELKHFLYSAYQSDTAYKTCVSAWNRSNPTYGHCAVTAMIVNEYFGGCIQFGYYEKGQVWHYWNVIDGKIIDFTIDQFHDDIIRFTKIQNATFDDLYAHKSVKSRYILLKERMKNIQEEFWRINDNILNCSNCKNVHSPAFWTVSFGSDCRVLIVGEAPAKNGWRVTGKAWKNEKGNLVPTGKTLQKLLTEIELDLSSVTYMEAIKCYPENGRVTKEQQICCKHFCLEQIGLLKPQIVLSMGKYATEYLLGNNHKFSEVVGTQILQQTKYGDFTIIPIYHTSPASPVSYKGNKKIFENIKRIMDA